MPFGLQTKSLVVGAVVAVFVLPKALSLFARKDK